MGWPADIRTYLLSKSSITSLIGTRVYPDYIPQKNSTYPAIVYQVISDTPDHTLAGAALHTGTRVQLDVYAETSLVRAQVVEALRNVLQGFPPAGTTTMGSSDSTVSSVKYLNSFDIYEPPQDNSDTGLFRNSTDYWFRLKRTAPTFT